jgi:hypothetical protein
MPKLLMKKMIKILGKLSLLELAYGRSNCVRFFFAHMSCYLCPKFECLIIDFGFELPIAFQSNQVNLSAPHNIHLGWNSDFVFSPAHIFKVESFDHDVRLDL